MTLFVVIYLWKLNHGREAEFRQAWREATEATYTKCGSLGSQLMEWNGGTYYAVARWPTGTYGLQRSNPTPAAPQASQTMGELTEVSFPTVELEVTDDMLKLETHS